jgi:hypothetical protein
MMMKLFSGEIFCFGIIQLKLFLLQIQVKANGNNISSNEKKIESSPKITRRMERLIDEKCNLLSKSGISKEGTVHLAQWMKGQFNKQVCASEPIESDEEENSQLQDWSEEDVKRRSSELNLLDGKKPEENLSEDDQKSASKSTTSDSQVKQFHELFERTTNNNVFYSKGNRSVKSH